MKNTIKKPTKQIYQNYSSEDFNVWKTLFNRQLKILKGIVADEFLFGLRDLGFSPNSIPNFLDINKILKNYTGWSIKTVSNISPPKEFFSCLAKKKFTTTCWLRSMSQIDYLEEPDMFHDVFSMCPCLAMRIIHLFLRKLAKLL